MATRNPKLEWSPSPTMDPHDTDQLRPLIERWQVRRLWTVPHRIKPRLVTKVFGDGRKLLAVFPIMFRPNHFVVRMDSKIETTYADDWLDDIYSAIEEEFYEWPWARQYGLKYHDDDGAENDSRLSFNDGSCWSEMDWPRVKAARAARRV